MLKTNCLDLDGFDVTAIQFNVIFKSNTSININSFCSEMKKKSIFLILVLCEHNVCKSIKILTYMISK